MTKKVPKKILRIERNFFVNLRKKIFFGRPRRAAAAAADRIDRRADADTMTSAHRSRGAALEQGGVFSFEVFCFEMTVSLILSIDPAAKGLLTMYYKMLNFLVVVCFL